MHGWIIPAEYHGREQSYLKHLVLEKYLDQWAHKLGSTARYDTTRLWYVDTFAGPWNQRTSELRDTSFAIGLNALESAARTWRERGLTLEICALFVEKDESAYAELERYLSARQSDVKTKALRGEFGEHCDEISKMLGSDPAFIFVDPLGWKGAAMRYIAPLTRNGPRDVMINVMFDHLNRQKDRLVEHIRDQMRDFFGLESSDLPSGLNEDKLFEFYRAQLKLKCGLQYAADLIVPHPMMDRAKFHLVVGGKNKAVIEVFREVERRVIGDEAGEIRNEVARRVCEQTTGQLSLLRAPVDTDAMYRSVHTRDVDSVKCDVLEILGRKGPIPFDDIWPEVLQSRHLTVVDMKHIIWAMHETGAIAVQNLSSRERTVKSDHVLSLVNASSTLSR